MPRDECEHGSLKRQCDHCDLIAEVAELQRALYFWLPTMPAKLPNESMYERLDHDISLLAGYDGPMEGTAEEMGWIALSRQVGADHG